MSIYLYRHLRGSVRISNQGFSDYFSEVNHTSNQGVFSKSLVSTQDTLIGSERALANQEKETKRTFFLISKNQTLTRGKRSSPKEMFIYR